MLTALLLSVRLRDMYDSCQNYYHTEAVPSFHRLSF